MSFTLLDHTADAKFQAHGPTLEAVFASAVEALAAIATTDTVQHTSEQDIRVQARDLEGLLFGLIERIIFLIDTEKFLACRTSRMEITRGEEGYRLHATLSGDDVMKHGCNLKAPTYSEMFVREEDDAWVLQAVVDI